MFSEKLFDHKYDIDDLIIAFCASDKGGRFILNSRTGEITYESKEEISSSIYKDGDDKGHIREILPLPNSFINEIKMHREFKRASTEKQQEINEVLNNLQGLQQLPSLFDEPYGGWLRERVKEACIEWLELHNMIPPSMKHVVDISTPEEKPLQGAKVTIQ